MTGEKEASAEMPTRDDIARIVFDCRIFSDVGHTCADRILALFAPILAEKEREIAATHDAYQQAAVDTVALLHEAEARALAAEAALAAEREDAARYRHLRTNFLREHHLGRLTWYLPTRYPLTAEALDESIDRNIAAAIREQGE